MGSAAQAECATEHVLHGGVYARTVRLPAGVVGVGVLIKVPTVLIVRGMVELLVGDEVIVFDGYNVLTGCAGRKQVFRTFTEVEMTMLFATTARTVDEAEREFTDEYEQLMSRRGTGEQVCPE